MDYKMDHNGTCAAEFCRTNGYQVWNDEWLGIWTGSKSQRSAVAAVTSGGNPITPEGLH